MPSLPCTRCGVLLDEPAYYRMTSTRLPNRDSMIDNVLWLCASCYAMDPPEERSRWLARSSPAVPGTGKHKGKLRSLFDNWLGRSPGR